MTELRIYRGLPASGKTTLAKEWVAEDPAHRHRVNRDDLRQMLNGGVYLGHDTEKHVVAARDRLIDKLIRSGVSVASDDTNLPQPTARDLVKLARKADPAVEIVVVDLTDVALDTCLDRNAVRIDRGERGVPDTAIYDMHERYLKGRELPLPSPADPVAPSPPVEQYVAPIGAPACVMVDLDGTLALHDGRDIYDETRVSEDLPNQPVLATVTALHRLGLFLVFCTGRTEACRADTTAWLNRFIGIALSPLDMPLFMRQVGDKRKDSIVKREMFDREIRERYDVMYVLDDRQQVVDMWRSLGLTVFQVAEGNF